jgi:DedD protein
MFRYRTAPLDPHRMPVFSFLKRKLDTARGDAHAGDEAAEVMAARARARRRLIGAVVLLGIGIVAFPLIFETQPRPVAVDLPIERADPGATVAVPNTPTTPAMPTAPARSAGKVETERSDESTAAGKPAASAPATATATIAPPAVAASVAKVNPAPAPATASQGAAESPQRAAEARRALALLEGKAATPAVGQPPAVSTKADAEPAGGRFVVQAGAYGDSASLRVARQRVEKLGLKTYTQVVQTESGQRTRVRVGPYATRDEAEQAAALIKGSGLAASILTL